VKLRAIFSTDEIADEHIELYNKTFLVSLENVLRAAFKFCHSFSFPLSMADFPRTKLGRFNDMSVTLTVVCLLK
jgi:hypothetical protein